MSFRRSSQSIAGARIGRGTARLGFALVSAGLCLVLSAAWAGMAAADEAPAAVVLVSDAAAAGPLVLAQQGGTEPRELEPRYPAPPPGEPGPYNEEEHRFYNSDYIFGLSRSLGHSTIVPAAKAPLFLFTVPLDIVFLPFALIGGFFG